MKARAMLLKAAVLGTSLLLLTGFVSYRATGALPFQRSAAPDRPVQRSAETLPGSKSMVVFEAAEEAKDRVPLLPGSKSAPAFSEVLSESNDAWSSSKSGRIVHPEDIEPGPVPTETPER